METTENQVKKKRGRKLGVRFVGGYKKKEKIIASPQEVKPETTQVQNE